MPRGQESGHNNARRSELIAGVGKLSILPLPSNRVHGSGLGSGFLPRSRNTLAREEEKIMERKYFEIDPFISSYYLASLIIVQKDPLSFFSKFCRSINFHLSFSTLETLSLSLSLVEEGENAQRSHRSNDRVVRWVQYSH